MVLWENAYERTISVQIISYLTTTRPLVQIILSRTISELCLEMPWSPSYDPSKCEAANNLKAQII